MQFRLLSAAVASALLLSVAAADAQTVSQSGPSIAANFAAASSISRAKALASSSAAVLVKRADADEFVAKDVIVDVDGTEHVRFERTYRGLPVIGGDFVLHSKDGKTLSVSKTIDSIVRPSIFPGVTADRAIVEAGTRFGTNFTTTPTATLVVYAVGLHNRRLPKLAWQVSYDGAKLDNTPSSMRYYVDARTGKVLAGWDTIHTAVPGRGDVSCDNPQNAVGIGHSLFLGDVQIDTVKCGTTYKMIDNVRGGGVTASMGFSGVLTGAGAVVTDQDNVWGNGQLNNSQSVAVDANVGIASTWDYYRDVLGRLGIANDGKGVVTRVHFSFNYANAFWSDECFCMTFGDGDGVTIKPLTSLDIAAHEMTHGVTSKTADMVYAGESGGLNEATSDIFGAMVEYHADDALDAPDYLIGEEIFINNPTGLTALRYMFKPSLDTVSYDCYVSNIGEDDVHFSSGVANHFFYLLAEGVVVPTGFGPGTTHNLSPQSLVCNGDTAIAGIGREAAAKIWYRALTVYFTTSTNYAGARVATLQAASDLFGANSTQRRAVASAWSAVAVN